MRKYDVVVIGAGNGGLAAAAKVLNGGKTCLVCEKHNIPGGFATSFVRGRFEFEASLHEFNGIQTAENPGSARLLFNELGVGDKIEWIQLKDAYRLISLKEGYDIRMPFGLEAFTEASAKLHPEGRKCMEVCLKHNKPISTVTLDDLCKFLDCNVEDIVCYKKDKYMACIALTSYNEDTTDELISYFYAL